MRQTWTYPFLPRISRSHARCAGAYHPTQPTEEQPRATGRLTVRACQSCAPSLRLATQCSPLESSRGHGSLESDDGKAQSLPAELLRSSCSASAFEQDAQALRLQKFYDTHGLPGADMTGLHHHHSVTEQSPCRQSCCMCPARSQSLCRPKRCCTRYHCTRCMTCKAEMKGACCRNALCQA